MLHLPPCGWTYCDGDEKVHCYIKVWKLESDKLRASVMWFPAPGLSAIQIYEPKIAAFVCGAFSSNADGSVFHLLEGRVRRYSLILLCAP